MGWVKRQRQVYFTARGHHVGRETLVVFDVAMGLVFRLAFKFVEQVRRLFTQGVDQGIQTTTVRHADNNFLGTVRAKALNQFIHQGNQ